MEETITCIFVLFPEMINNRADDDGNNCLLIAGEHKAFNICKYLIEEKGKKS